MSDPFFYVYEMLAEFEKKVAAFAKANGLFESADKILLAVSGGADSTALIYAMQALKAEGVLDTELACAHINHQLRGNEADADEYFVIAQTTELKLPVTTRQLNVCGFARENKLSIETAARKLRIESLLDIARVNNCSRIATAHQKDDNAETVLQRLARGTGFRGLGGIWPMRAFAGDICFVRPLLCVRRDEIIEYLKKRNLKWRVDKSNEDCKYRRNYIRHRLLPALQQQSSGSVVEQLFGLSQSAQRFYNLVCGSAEKSWQESTDYTGNKVALDLKMFSNQPPVVKVELVRRCLTALGSGERDLTQRHYEKILQLAEQNISGRKIELPNGFMVWREYEKLIFALSERGCRSGEQISKSAKLEIPGRAKFGRHLIEAAIFETEVERIEEFKVHKNNFIEWFDLDKVKLPLTIRLRQTGDRFVPLGMAREKKVGKFLTAAKVLQEIRRKTLIVADNEKIIWVWPIRISERAKVAAKTRKILRLQITDADLIH